MLPRIAQTIDRWLFWQINNRHVIASRYVAHTRPTNSLIDAPVGCERVRDLAVPSPLTGNSLNAHATMT
jgi:hypothetical protein